MNVPSSSATNSPGGFNIFPVEDPQVFIKPNQILVPVIDSCTYAEFDRNHLSRNFPCVIRRVGRNWKASKLWCENEKPCFEYLKNQYGESIITAYHCEEKLFDSHTTSKMKFKEYIDYWKNYNEAKDKTKMKLLYLKDWHMKNEYKDDDFYEVPFYFSSDWLNEYLVANEKDDYRFVYMGPAGSWTPVHRDVMNSYSWSVNICGYKRWILFPLGEERKLLNGKQLPFSIKQVPSFVKYCEVIQHPGDALFVPSGWHHIVWNFEDTISINHNWANGSNIFYMEIGLRESLLEVEMELVHLTMAENFQMLCQKVLKQHAGMDYEDFFEFVRWIALRRLQTFANNIQRSNVPLENELVFYDLNKCLEVLFNLKHSLQNPETLKEANTLIKQIEYMLQI